MSTLTDLMETPHMDTSPDLTSRLEAVEAALATVEADLKAEQERETSQTKTPDLANLMANLEHLGSIVGQLMARVTEVEAMAQRLQVYTGAPGA